MHNFLLGNNLSQMFCNELNAFVMMTKTITKNSNNAKKIKEKKANQETGAMLCSVIQKSFVFFSAMIS